MDEGQRETLQLVRHLLGKWQGKGVAEFPTIPTFEYREELEFTANETQPILRYTLAMSTTTVPQLTPHAHAELMRRDQTE